MNRLGNPLLQTVQGPVMSACRHGTSLLHPVHKQDRSRTDTTYGCTPVMQCSLLVLSTAFVAVRSGRSQAIVSFSTNTNLHFTCSCPFTRGRQSLFLQRSYKSRGGSTSSCLAATAWATDFFITPISRSPGLFPCLLPKKRRSDLTLKSRVRTIFFTEFLARTSFHFINCSKKHNL